MAGHDSGLQDDHYRSAHFSLLQAPFGSHQRYSTFWPSLDKPSRKITHVPISHATLQCSANPLCFHAPYTQSIIPEYGGLRVLSGSSLSLSQVIQETKGEKSKREQNRMTVSYREKHKEMGCEGDRAACCQREGVVQ